MALQLSINHRESSDKGDEDDNHHHEFDEEIVETEDDLIENYRFLSKHCGVLRQSPTTGVLNTIQQQQQKQKQQNNQSLFLRQYSSIDNSHDNNNEYERSVSSTKQYCSPLNNVNNNNDVNDSNAISRVPPTIYYDDTADDGYSHHRSFSLIKLFARMKTRLKHDRRYHPKSSHELLCESDPQEWYELTKNVRPVLNKVLLPDGGYDELMRRSKSQHNRQDSYKKSRDYDRVLYKDNDDDYKIDVDIDDDFNTEGDEEYDEIIWKKFQTCSRGSNYRRCAICKAVDRQQFQGQLVYFYGVANNILIDENLKASGLG